MNSIREKWRSHSGVCEDSNMPRHFAVSCKQLLMLQWIILPWFFTQQHSITYQKTWISRYMYVLQGVTSLLRGGADKSLARPGLKQATATKLGIYSTYSPRSSIRFLVRCFNFCKPLKKIRSCPSNQVFAAAMTSTSDEKWRPCNCFFFSPGNRW